MDRPYVTIHNLISLDGFLDGFPANVGLYYELVGRLPHQAVLAGSGTFLAAAASQGVDMSGEDAEPSAVPEPQRSQAGPDLRPLLVIVDSSGKLTRYAWLREQPFWRDILVLCAKATPAGQLKRLRRHHVGHAVVGENRVDLAAALRMLAGRYGVTAVRVDAGGGLNGALLRAGLVDEISVVVAPYLAASAAAGQPRLITGAGCPACTALEMTGMERLRDGHIWLRYSVCGTSSNSVD
jgi:2,5-diamino-6-(ribosylamino)-4(3H)-pyrimidinone 5'-phosphate reductase